MSGPDVLKSSGNSYAHNNAIVEADFVRQSICYILNEPRSDKNGFLYMRKQRRRSASR